ncbi:hypothetical protein K438DRAFT_1759939 [Mycena galopus ATCC 62051]|nr:hypothetical protein K438DRAFT_1759939 [Mycena galopus ATCC 62051]
MSAVEAKEDTSESEARARRSRHRNELSNEQVTYLVWVSSHLGQTHVNFWSSPIKDPVARHMGYCQEKIAFRSSFLFFDGNPGKIPAGPFTQYLGQYMENNHRLRAFQLTRRLPVMIASPWFVTSEICIYDSAREIELNRVTSNSVANSVTQVSQQCDKIRVVGSTANPWVQHLHCLSSVVSGFAVVDFMYVPPTGSLVQDLPPLFFALLEITSALIREPTPAALVIRRRTDRWRVTDISER